MQRVSAGEQLPVEFDAGYQVLLDRRRFDDATRAAHVFGIYSHTTDGTRVLELLEGFFLDTTYVAKFLWRDDLMAAKHILDYSLKQGHLRPLLEWHAEIEHQWSLENPDRTAADWKQYSRPDLWADLERTYTDAELDQNWEALFLTIELMRRASLPKSVSIWDTATLNGLEQRVVNYLRKVKQLDRDAESF